MKIVATGTVNLNTPTVDPSRGLVALPAMVVDKSGLIAQGCAAGDRTTGSQFVVTGRGGDSAPTVIPRPGDCEPGGLATQSWRTPQQ